LFAPSWHSIPGGKSSKQVSAVGGPTERSLPFTGDKEAGYALRLRPASFGGRGRSASFGGNVATLSAVIARHRFGASRRPMTGSSGRSSIPEALTIKSQSRGVLDTPLFAGYDGSW
jgi:hypothetical protein